MRAFDPSDIKTKKEIENIQNRLNTIIALAIEKEKTSQLFEAKQLYTEAQHLSFHAGEGLRVKIINEEADIKTWHWINKKIETLHK
ncbi:Uncharacterised protein [Legionella wadsworthii]|uniref:Uncharacterized protein n=1 Tax=Legionella wadsworthii TaxID=28088 RepID=A0A378LR18_9GAMM|nr:hypothetical protein [Legionella wadsworthii]STY28810.1 Uncharacterised protein [Legionella wadsworthii]